MIIIPENDPLNSNAQLWAEEMISRLDSLPVMSFDVFSRYVVMVHNTLTGQRIGISDLLASRSVPEGIQPHPAEERNRSKVYKAEQAMLQMVRCNSSLCCKVAIYRYAIIRLLTLFSHTLTVPLFAPMSEGLVVMYWYTIC